MIPPRVPEGTPMSERKIFEKLALDPDTKDWTVLHSLALKKTNIGPYGEIDLVILVPGKGIVCIEVKGGEVTCKDGVWKTRNRKTGKTSTLNKSPFLQAREGMFALRKDLQKHFGGSDPAARCPTSYAVIFPDVPAPPSSTEAENWETIDIASLRRPISKLVSDNIFLTLKKIPGKKNPDSYSSDTLGRVRQFLRPDFDMVVSRSTRISRSEEQLVSLTEEQYVYLDIASENERALVTGAAGTGKTLLALEFVRNEAAAGRKVLLLCYNKVLAGWMKKAISDEGLAGVDANHLHAFLSGVIKNSSYQGEFSDKAISADGAVLYSELFPFYSELALGETGSEYDTLVIDEAQDIINPQNLPVLNLVVSGGLAGGRWAIFGDFTRQAIYGTQGKEDGHNSAKEQIGEYAPHFAQVPLKVNCRNTHQIGEETALLSGFDALPYRFNQADGLPVDYRYWKNRSEEADQLVRVIEKLTGEGVAPSDIVILSPARLENSVIPEMERRIEVGIIDISEATDAENDCIVFSTIHSFKGMESPVVILTGLTGFEDDRSRALLYVGMSRARSHLLIVAKDSLKKILPELMKKKLTTGWSG